MFDTLAAFSGIIATIWIVFGIFFAGKFYPGYDHSKQFCSELGASGSPTEKLSPLINNYPLGFLFCFFGGYVIQLSDVSVLVNIAGGLIIVHGLGTWIAGYFPMDQDPYTKNPSVNCKIHSWAGFIMLLVLLIAPLLIVISPTEGIISASFRIFSLLVIAAAIYYLYMMAKAVKTKGTPGTYQRISYGIQLLWLSVFSILLG